MRLYGLVLFFAVTGACGFDSGVGGFLVDGDRGSSQGGDQGNGGEQGNRPDAGVADAGDNTVPEPNPTPTPTCVDQDGDGYDGTSSDCVAGTDCDDDDADVHPNQMSFFTVARADGSFDYDCDGSEAFEVGTVYSGNLPSACDAFDGDNNGIATIGWQSNLVPCGASGRLLYCDGDELESATVVQGCR